MTLLLEKAFAYYVQYILRLFKKMNSAISENDWKEAAKEGRDSRWYRQVGARAERLVNRMREIES